MNDYVKYVKFDQSAQRVIYTDIESKDNHWIVDFDALILQAKDYQYLVSQYKKPMNYLQFVHLYFVMKDNRYKKNPLLKGIEHYKDMFPEIPAVWQQLTKE